MSPELDDVARSIARLLGMAPDDLDSDHGRWQLYEEAIKRGLGPDLLFRAVALEDVGSLAVSIVLRMLELVPEDQYSAWIEQLAPDNRTYSIKRAAEIRILKRADSGGLDMQEVASSLGSWSDWLQLRLATSVDDTQLLSIISTHGRTERVRSTAAGRTKRLMT